MKKGGGDDLNESMADLLIIANNEEASFLCSPSSEK